MTWTNGVFTLPDAATDAFPGKVLTSSDWNTVFTAVIAGFNDVGETFDARLGNLFLSSGAAINIAASDWVAVHTAGILNVTTGDVQVTTAGTNAQSVVTLNGTQSLANKTLTAPTLSGTTTLSGTAMIDVPEISAPASPAADTVRLYCRDIGGTSRLAYKDSAGAESILTTSAGVTVIRVQRFTITASYTPHANMLYVMVEGVAGGGSGAGGTGSATGVIGGGGGGSGGYSRHIASKADIGASQVVTVGAAGTAPAAGNNNGGTGGNTSVGTLLICSAGVGGNYGSTAQLGTGGAGGAANTGNILANPGQNGSNNINATIGTVLLSSGEGASGVWGQGGQSGPNSGAGTANTGSAAAGFGAGGGGGFANTTAATFAGGNGVSWVGSVY